MNRRLRDRCAPTGPVSRGQLMLGRRHFGRHGWLATLLFPLVLLASLGGTVLGPGWPPDTAPPRSPFETLGARPADHAPIALTGPRSIAVAVGLSETRPRPGQVGEPTSLGLANLSSQQGSPIAAAPRPPHLVRRGLLGVRAPPVALL